MARTRSRRGHLLPAIQAEWSCRRVRTRTGRLVTACQETGDGSESWIKGKGGTWRKVRGAGSHDETPKISTTRAKVRRGRR